MEVSLQSYNKNKLYSAMSEDISLLMITHSAPSERAFKAQISVWLVFIFAHTFVSNIKSMIKY